MADVYLDALIKEIHSNMSKAERFSPLSVFIGGGTPSLLPPASLERILLALSEHCDVGNAIEFTMECNPGASESQFFADYRSLGVNRLSIGIQSFVPSELRFLNRIHTAGEAQAAVQTAAKAGFENLSLDLIFAVPGQTPESWRYSLSRAIELPVSHISAYSLIYEEGTPLYKRYIRGALKIIEEDEDTEMFFDAGKILGSAGLSRYEISNFAKPGFECLHNLHYWRRGEYYAFGPSAHSYLNGERKKNVADLREYVRLINRDGNAVIETEALTAEQITIEKIYLGLRAEGMKLDDFSAEGYDAPKIKNLPFVVDLQKEGLAKLNGNLLTLTERGRFLADGIAERLISILGGDYGDPNGNPSA